MDVMIDQVIDKPPYFKKISDDKVINLTGESGSGKSTFSNIYKQNSDFLVVDYDKILSPKEGTIEFELKNVIFQQLGVDFFAKMKNASFDEMRHMFSNMYEVSLNYLKTKNKIIVLDGSQLRYIDDVKKIKGQVIALRTSIETCIERAVKRSIEKNPEMNQEEINQKRLKKKREFQQLTPFLNNLLIQIDNIDLNRQDGKSEYVGNLMDMLMSIYSDIPSQFIAGFKQQYMQDKRNIEDIQKEIILSAKEIGKAEKIVSTPISQEILDNSILLVGPMGTGKTTISKAISQYNNMPLISFDDTKSFLELRSQRENFGKDFKRYEFFLSTSILTSLTEPSVIDFGGGHSVYENPLMFYEFKKLLSRFKNVILILPSQNMEESLKILSERLKERNPMTYEKNIQTNEHFVKSACNYELAKNILYTKDKDIISIINEINYLSFGINDVWQSEKISNNINKI